jgi:hypothetical protein
MEFEAGARHDAVCLTEERLRPDCFFTAPFSTAKSTERIEKGPVAPGLYPGKETPSGTRPRRANRLRAVRTGGVGKGQAECRDAVVATPRCSFCRGRVQQALSRVLRKGEADSQSSIQLHEFHPSCGVGAHWTCRRATTGNGRAKSPGIGREAVGVCAHAPLPTRNRYRLASAACFHPAAIGMVLAGLKQIEA